MDRGFKLVDYVILESVFAFNRAKIKMRIAFQNVRRAFWPIDLICDVVEFAASALNSVFNKLIHSRMEPECESWIGVYQCEFADQLEYDTMDDEPFSIYYKGSANYNSAKTDESYYLFERQFESLSDFQEAFAYKYRRFCDKHSESPFGKLILARAFPDIVRIKRVESANPKDVESIVRSGVSFFSVDYSAKIDGKAYSVTIDIPKSHYAIGNELLSVEYVSRYLEHLPIYQQCGFNGTYNLQIIDEDMNFLNLNETQWIHLTNTGYEIRGADKDESAADETKIE
jgi:hypothetical protein